MYIDWTYIVLVLPAVIFSLWASSKVKLTFAKYSRQSVSSGMTGADVARSILDANGLNHVRIEQIEGELTDHYDPKNNIVRLSRDVYFGPTMASIGVAAHECGHAIQHSERYSLLKLRMAIIPITNIGSKLATPLIMIGLIFSYLGSLFTSIAYLGVICFSLCALFQLITLPVEFNASHRAIAFLGGCGYLSEEEVKGSKKVLSAAAMTYVAALAVSIMEIIRLLLIVGRHDRD